MMPRARMLPHVRCVNVFVEDERACGAGRALYVTKIRTTGLASSRPSGISEVRT